MKEEKELRHFYEVVIYDSERKSKLEVPEKFDDSKCKLIEARENAIKWICERHKEIGNIQFDLFFHPNKEGYPITLLIWSNEKEYKEQDNFFHDDLIKEFKYYEDHNLYNYDKILLGIEKGKEYLRIK